MKRKKSKPIALEQQSLWEFSLSVYGEPEVEQACLLMQDKLDIDVNLLFLCLWLGTSGRGCISADELIDVESQIAFWQHEIIVPLRQVRHRLKNISHYGGDRFNAVRKSVLSSELDAERVEQTMLEQAFIYRVADVSRGQARCLADAIENILMLLRQARYLESGWSRSIAILVAACFSQLSCMDIKNVIDDRIQQLSTLKMN